jgi:hypothetical protein
VPRAGRQSAGGFRLARELRLKPVNAFLPWIAGSKLSPQRFWFSSSHCASANTNLTEESRKLTQSDEFRSKMKIRISRILTFEVCEVVEAASLEI